MGMYQRYSNINCDIDNSTKDANGYYHDTAIVGRTGLLTYYNADGTKRIEYRPPNEAFNEDSLRTLSGIPITNMHPKKIVDENTYDSCKPIGTVMSKGKQDGENIVCDLVIYDLAQCGDNRELSCGYRVETVDEAGITPEGQHYDALQTNIVYNHLAVVPKGRAGNAHLNLDSEGNQMVNDDEIKNNNGNSNMEDKNNKIMIKLNIDGKEYEVEDSVASFINSKTSEATMLQAKNDALESKIKTMNSDMKEKIDNIVNQTIEVRETAKKIGLEKFDEMDNESIKKSIIMKTYPEVKLDGKTEDYIDALYDVAKIEKQVDKKEDSKKVLAQNNKDMLDINNDNKVLKFDEISPENIDEYIFK